MKKIKQYRLKGIYYRSFMILIVIPILIVFIAAIFIIRQMMEDSAIRNIERVQKNMCMNLENEIQDAALRLSHFLYVNDGTITKAAAKTDTYDMEKKRVLSKELDRYFNFAMCPIEDIAAATFFMKNGNYTNLKEDFSISMAEIKGADWYVQALKEKNKVSVGSFNKKITSSKYGQNPFYIAVAISPDIRVDQSGRIETAMLIVVSDLEKTIKSDTKDDSLGNTILLDEKNEVFSEDEIPVIVDYLKKNPTIWNLGVLLVLQTGVRVGELSALKPCDWDGKNILRVRRTEIRYKNEKGKNIVDVREFAKTEAGMRDIILSDGGIETLKKILELNPDGEYLFENESGKRIRGNTFNKRLDIVLNKVDLHHRSIHKGRKTYGTTLIDSGCEDSLVMKQMGHTTIETSRKYYYYSNKTKAHQIEQIKRAVNI